MSLYQGVEERSSTNGIAKSKDAYSYNLSSNGQVAFQKDFTMLYPTPTSWRCGLLQSAYHHLISNCYLIKILMFLCYFFYLFFWDHDYIISFCPPSKPSHISFLTPFLIHGLSFHQLLLHAYMFMYIWRKSSLVLLIQPAQSL